LLKKCVSWNVLASSCFSDRKACNAPIAQTVFAPKLLLPLFTWWCRWLEHFVNVPYLTAGSGEKFFFCALTIVVWVEFVVGRDVGYGMIWTIWRQAASCISSLVHLIILNNAKSAFWLSITLE
jgi:hypothetical protein